MAPIEEWIICPNCERKSWVIYDVTVFYETHTELECGHDLPAKEEIVTMFTTWGDDTTYDSWESAMESLNDE